MEIREAHIEEAEEACAVIRYSITDLCHADHQGDAPTLSLWLANKTTENMRRWIVQTYVFVAAEQGQILGVGAVNGSGEITLNYVSPDARFRGISKALLQRLELQASYLGIRNIILQSSLTALRFHEFIWLPKKRAANKAVRDHVWASNDQEPVVGAIRPVRPPWVSRVVRPTSAIGDGGTGHNACQTIAVQFDRLQDHHYSRAAY